MLMNANPMTGIVYVSDLTLTKCNIYFSYYYLVFLYSNANFRGTLLNILLKHLKLQIILPMERAANAIMVILILLQLLAGLLKGQGPSAKTKAPKY